MDSTSGYALRSIHEGNFKLEDLCQRALWNYLEPAASGSGFLAGAVPLVKRTPPPDAYEIPFMPASLSDIAAASRIEKPRAEKLLMNMADKGVVYAFDQKGETMYLLFSFETIYNYPIKYRPPDMDQTRLRSLWKEYFEEGWDRTPGTYVVPGRVLPVQENLSTCGGHD